MRKIYIVPNFVTTANMFCGFCSVAASHQGDFVFASWAIILAGVFDLLDGRIARLAKATSSFGVEYDSLSDLVSFGVAPAVLIHHMMLGPLGRYGLVASFLFLACGALRLARFNVSATPDAPKGHFQGLPSPAGAGAVATFTLFRNETGLFPESWLPGVGLFLVFCVGSLMVSTLAFQSFKGFHWRSRAAFPTLLGGILVALLVALKPEVTLFSLLWIYILMSLGIWVMKGSSKTRTPLEANTAP